MYYFLFNKLETSLLPYLSRFQNSILSYKFEFLDPSCSISRKAHIYGASKISIKANTIISSYATLQCADPYNLHYIKGSIEIGSNCVIQSYAYLNSSGGKIKLGDYCSVNPYALLYGHGGLTIGNHVRIAAHAVIIPANHNYQRIDIPIHQQGLTRKGVEIKDDVWIGLGVYILDGVIVETGCVIGAGSVVTKSTEPYGVYVGNPARRVKDR